VSDVGEIVRLRLDMSYEGTDFSGWAIQPDLRTVAGVLTDALQMLLRERLQLVVAGRTDAGVHAVGQVAHVDVSVEALQALAPRGRAGPPDALPGGAVPPDALPGGTGRPAAGAAASAAPGDDLSAARTGLLRRLAGVLPLDLRVRRITAAPAGFDARFAALRRHYRYRIGTAEWGVEPQHRQYVFARRRALDVESMTLAASGLVGLKDFAAFCRPREGASTVRHLQALAIHAVADEVHIDVTADAFCHSMVRALVGSLLSVGELRVPVSRPAELQAAAKRSSQIHVAPAHGLTLMAVDYPPDAELAARTEITRAHRTSPGVGDAPIGEQHLG
jgi:tRNA pseudouridine38-40 synthase